MGKEQKDSPFIFGKIVGQNNFTNRKADFTKIKNNIINNINTILISPRRWGKSSLVHNLHTAFNKNENYIFCHIDLFSLRDENDFYEYYIKTIAKATSNKIEEWTKTIYDFLSKLKPKISFQTEPFQDLTIQFDFKSKNIDSEDILNFPENLAIKKNIKIVICIDEFQNMIHFNDPEAFQKKLRSVWQKHNNVIYILYGSKRHILTEIFGDKSKPFYRFGDLIFLDKIEKEELSSFIINRFKSTNKHIGKKYADQISEIMECNPYYVQQLAYFVWVSTKNKVNIDILNSAVDSIITQNNYLYIRDFDSLSLFQIRFLRALLDGVSTNYYKGDIIKKYKLSSSANVKSIIKSLVNKELIELKNREIEFLDPVFKLWLKKLFLKDY